MPLALYPPIYIEDVGHIQSINNAYSEAVNLDYFSVKVSTLPIKTGTTRYTPSEFLSYIRTNINSFVSDNTFTPYNAYGINDNTLWNSSDPTGAIVAIDIQGPENGSVVTSYSSPSKWTFTTIHEPMYGDHPVSGNRDFGYTTNPDGSYTFYTRGVDRLTSWEVTYINDVLIDNIAYNSADDLWESLQTKISTFVNQHSGQANIIPHTAHRPDWYIIKKVVDGELPLSMLSTDCP